jgi:hypothetical protein
MSMGGGSDGVRPVRRSSYTPRMGTGSGSDDNTPDVPNSNYEPTEPADESLPTYVGVGGGLSNRRVVKKLPQDLQGETPYESSLVKIIKYVISPDVATSDADQTVVEDVRERVEMPDCRLLINNPAGLGTPYNLGREHLQDKLGDYLVQKEQTTGNGTVKVNFCDIAIVTHDEGGYRGLENRL